MYSMNRQNILLSNNSHHILHDRNFLLSDILHDQNVLIKSNNLQKVSSTAFPNLSTFYNSCRHQPFPFHSPMMNYIFKNPKSLNGYLKLIQSCKEAFISNPLVIVNTLLYSESDGWKFCSRKCCSGSTRCEKCLSVDFDRIQSKFWISGALKIFGSSGIHSNYASKVIQKLFHCCDIDYLILEGQNLAFNEFLKLAPFIKNKCSFSDISVTKIDGSNLLLDEIMSHFNGVQTFTFKYGTSDFPYKDIKCLANLCSRFKSVTLFNVPNIFNIVKFNEYLKSNSNKAIINLSFNQTFTDDRQSEILQFLENIISTNDYGFEMASLKYSNMTAEIKSKLEKIAKRKHEIRSMNSGILPTGLPMIVKRKHEIRSMNSGILPTGLPMIPSDLMIDRNEFKLRENEIMNIRPGGSMFFIILFFLLSCFTAFYLACFF